MSKKVTKVAAEAAPRSTMRRYDKGERRYKHVGTSDKPEIEFHPENPKYWIGKCPANISDADKVRLLNEAISADNGDREINFPKKLFVVDGGAIYSAQTTDRGKSYHGYPYRGKMSKHLLASLKQSAIAKKCEGEFEAWVKKHIEIHG